MTIPAPKHIQLSKMYLKSEIRQVVWTGVGE